MNFIPTPKDPLTPKYILAFLAASLTMTVSTAMLVEVLATTEQQQAFLEQSELDTIEQMWKHGQVEGCMQAIVDLPKGFRLRRKAQELLDQCRNQFVANRLQVVTDLINQGNLEYALNLLAELPPSKYMGTVQQQMTQLCDRLFETALQEYAKNSPQYLNNATYPLQQIPASASCYDRAQAQLTHWRGEFSQNQQQIEAAETAYRQSNFEAAAEALAQVSHHSYWQQKIEPFRQQLQYEPIRRRAETYLKRSQPGNALNEALLLPDTDPWAEQKRQLISRAEAKLRMQGVCTFLTQGHWDGCY